MAGQRRFLILIIIIIIIVITIITIIITITMFRIISIVIFSLSVMNSMLRYCDASWLAAGAWEQHFLFKQLTVPWFATDGPTAANGPLDQRLTLVWSSPIPIDGTWIKHWSNMLLVGWIWNRCRDSTHQKAVWWLSMVALLDSDNHIKSMEADGTKLETSVESHEYHTVPSENVFIHLYDYHI